MSTGTSHSQSRIGSGRRYGTTERIRCGVAAAGPEDDAELERHEHEQDRHQQRGDRREPGGLDERGDQDEDDRHERARDQEEREQRRQPQLLGQLDAIPDWAVGHDAYLGAIP